MTGQVRKGQELNMHLRMEFDSGVGPTCFVSLLLFYQLTFSTIYFPETYILDTLMHYFVWTTNKRFLSEFLPQKQLYIFQKSMKHIEVEVPHVFLVCQQNQHIFSSLLSATSISRKPMPRNWERSKDQRNFLLAQASVGSLLNETKCHLDSFSLVWEAPN